MINLEKAKQLINEYCLYEFESEADFSDMENIGVAYTTLTDYEIPIQVSIDLIHMKLKTWLGSTDMEPEKIEDITEEDLKYLCFDDLIAGWQFYIEDNLDRFV